MPTSDQNSVTYTRQNRRWYKESDKILPACGNPPTAGKDTFPKSGSMIFRFGKSGRGGRRPGKGIKAVWEDKKVLGMWCTKAML